MELKAEQIKSELEGLAKFRTCPEYIRTALALITSQEQRIKELTEENEAWQKALITEKENADKAYYELACEVEDLRAENERLNKEVKYWEVETKEARADIDQAVTEARADTVRKMQEKLIKGAFCSACGIDYSHHIIQIAKEMLEDKQ